MVVQHNLQAINANRMLSVTSSGQAKATEKLSSGYKINRAADDAAGLAISEKMRKQMRGLDRASTNAQDGVSAVQTAEGALNEVHDMLQRLNELAVQAANGTNSESDRESIQDEIAELTTEIDRVSETTKFNETELLKGALGTRTKVLVGHNAGLKGTFVDRVTNASLTVDLSTGTTMVIGGKSYNIVQAANKADLKGNFVTKNTMDSVQYLQEKVTDAEKSEDANATVTINGTVYSHPKDAAGNIQFNTWTAGTGDEYTTDQLRGKIADGDKVIIDIDPEKYLIGKVKDAFYKGTSLVYTKNDGTVTDLTQSGYSRGGSIYYDATGAMVTDPASDSIVGSLKWTAPAGNPTTVIKPKPAQSKVSFPPTLSNFDFTTNTKDVMSDGGLTNLLAGNGTLKLGDELLEISDAHVQQIARDYTQKENITAQDAADLICTALRQANNIGANKLSEVDLTDEEKLKLRGIDSREAVTFNVTKGWAEVPNILTFNLHVGSDSEMGNKITLDIDGMTCAGLGIKDLNVADDSGIAATYAIDAIADALQVVSAQRAALGAIQNRLEHTISNLDNVVENTTTAESRIRDTDMAEEMVEYSKNNILQQAGQSMLAQANQSTQGVLSLLQG